MCIPQDLSLEVARVYRSFVDSAPHGRFNAADFFRLCADDIRLSYEKDIRKKKGYWHRALASANIDLNTCGDVRVPHAEKGSRLVAAIKELGATLGPENLNDSSMNKSKSVRLPKSLIVHPVPTPNLSKELGHEPVMALQAFQRQCTKHFGSWSAALVKAGFNTEEIVRRVAKHDLMELIERFDEFDRQAKGEWNVASFRRDQPALHHALVSHAAALRKKIGFASRNGVVATWWIALQGFRKNNELSLRETSKTDLIQLEEKFLCDHENQIRWSEERLVVETLETLVSSGDLKRASIERENPALLAALRSPRWGTRNEQVTIEGMGIFHPENFNRISIIGDLMPLREVQQHLLNAVKDSLENQETMLSRKHFELNNFEAYQSAIAWAKVLNSSPRVYWRDALTTFGFPPKFWEKQQRLRSREGLEFERALREILGRYFHEVDTPSKITDDTQFCSGVRLKGCQHSPRCQPDFYFKNFIIDAKLGKAAARRSQLERYAEHCQSLVIVTLGGATDSVSVNGVVTTFISVENLVCKSKEILGVEMDKGDASSISRRMAKIKVLF